MKRFKNVMLGLVIFGLIITTVPSQAFASISEKKDSPEELYGIAGREYNTEAQPYNQEQQDPKAIKDIIISSDQVVLDHNGESEFIDVIGELGNGKYINLTNEVEWSSDNPDIAFADAGRILAIAPGEINVTVEYGGYKKVIYVSVLGSLNIADEIDRLNEVQPEYSTYGFSSSDRTTVIDNAKGMVNLEWTPTKDVRGWKNKKTFKAKTKYTGIPYSQTANQKDKAGFNKALAASDFYDNYTRFDIIMPKYGNDCSGFVSFSWGISRKTTSDFVSGIKDGTFVLRIMYVDE